MCRGIFKGADLVIGLRLDFLQQPDVVFTGLLPLLARSLCLGVSDESFNAETIVLELLSVVFCQLFERV